jgi:uncharacterized protein (DUF362 family)
MKDGLKEIEGSRNKESVLSSNPEVTWKEGEGRRGNLERAIEGHKVNNGEFWEKLKGQRVLVKPNMASPDFPNSCTHPESLRVLLENLVKTGVREIKVGDIPAVSVPGNIEGEREKFGEQLGYGQVIDEINNENPGIEIGFTELENSGDRLEKTGLPIVGIDADVVVNLVMPKEHGQYLFTCASKNLMGLVSPEVRGGYFHQHDEAGLATTLQQAQREMVGKNPQATMRDVVELFVGHKIRSAGETDGVNSQKMSDFIGDFCKTLEKGNIQVLTVVDGTTFMTGHEHSGKVHNLNMAAVGLNPLAVDKLVSRRVGLVEVPYLKRLSLANTVFPDGGEEHAAIKTRESKRVAKDVEVDESGSFKFSYALESSVPGDGFEKKQEEPEVISSAGPEKEKMEPKIDDIERQIRYLKGDMVYREAIEHIKKLKNEYPYLTNSLGALEREYLERFKRIYKPREHKEWAERFSWKVLDRPKKGASNIRTNRRKIDPIIIKRKREIGDLRRYYGAEGTLKRRELMWNSLAVAHRDVADTKIPRGKKNIYIDSLRRKLDEMRRFNEINVVSRRKHPLKK